MDCISTRLPYRQTNSFSKIALDYIDQLAGLKPFFAYAPTIHGLQKAIEARKQFTVDRALLVKELEKQYAPIGTSPEVAKNIESLLSPNTFTITTAHQNNIFTGPLYFIYKILHAIRLADNLKGSLPDYNFVPVYYIGSEDADLDELNHVYIGGEKLTWETKQTGAVGRMKIDAALLKLIDRMEGQLAVEAFGAEIIDLLRQYYKKGSDIQTATFGLVNALFSKYGLIVLLPDNAALKKQMHAVFENELLNQSSSPIVEKTAGELQNAGYKTQAHPREINLFYLKEDKRERIEIKGERYEVKNTKWAFSREEILDELKSYPDRFSPNVILRGLYQETILPNIAFIGGGGELAYWLELKQLFERNKVPYPVLVLRNSFLVLEKKWKERISKLGFTNEDIFKSEQELLNKLVARDTSNKLRLNGTFSQTEQLYEAIKKQAASIDTTLEKHVEALKYKTVYRLQELEKKMLRAEKRKFSEQQRHIHLMKEQLFPRSGLQERIDNFSYYYAKWGSSFIDTLYKESLSLEQEFMVLEEK